MNEPIKLSMSTGQPRINPIKQYPLKSIEAELWDFIKDNYENNQKSSEVEFRPICSKPVST
jgi:hypothetical protein